MAFVKNLIVAALCSAALVAVVNACGMDAPSPEDVLEHAAIDARDGFEHLHARSTAPRTDTTQLSKLSPKVTQRITEKAIRAHTRFIADTVTNGRMCGSDGELTVAKYIASRLEEAGVQPSGENGTYFQKVPLDAVTPVTKGNLVATSSSGATAVISWGTSGYVGSTQLHVSETVTLTDQDEVVFVGYGIVDSARNWNDYAGVNVSGKVVICLLGQPSSGVWASASMQWSARWNYKVAKASELGAKAVIQITTDESGYAFSSIVAQQGGTTIQSSDDFSDTPVAFYSWISQAAAENIAATLNETWKQWHTEANTTGFTPRLLPLKFTLENTYSFASVKGTNVVGIIPGHLDPSTAVVISGHIDHFGNINGSIYTGARDNAAGAAAVLNIATAFAAEGVSARQSIVFFFPTAEEHGLYGAKYFVAHPPGMIKNISTNINMDIPNSWGLAYDMMIIGLSLSNVGSVVSPWAAKQEGMYAISDAALSGMVYRGDSYAFILKGIPAIWPAFSTNYTSAYSTGLYQWLAWFGSYGTAKLCYHMPCDRYSDTIPLNGVAKNALVSARIAWAVADTKHFAPTLY